MKRNNFLRSLLLSPVIVAPIATKADTKTSYSFDELFEVWEKNDRLIYPKSNSDVYKTLRASFADRIENVSTCVYLPFRDTFMPIKERYTIDDFLPVKFCLETDKYRRERVTESGKIQKVAFRFIRVSPEKMHLELFLAHNSWNREFSIS